MLRHVVIMISAKLLYSSVHTWAHKTDAEHTIFWRQSNGISQRLITAGAKHVCTRERGAMHKVFCLQKEPEYYWNFAEMGNKKELQPGAGKV